MKKLVSVALVLALSLTLVACSTAVAAAENKTGLGIVTSIGSSAPVGEKDGEKTNGKAQVDSTICAVTIDDAGTIISISFDVAQTAIAFAPDGSIVTDLTAPITSKVEKKEAYGMKETSGKNGTNGGAGLELYEQVANLEAYCVGKKVADVLAIETFQKDDHHLAVPAGEDLKASVTIDVGAYLKALEKAAANAK